MFVSFLLLCLGLVWLGFDLCNEGSSRDSLLEGPLW